MPYKFSLRSRWNLMGVHPDLARLAHAALAGSAVDFGVTEGLRSKARQVELFQAGASRTLNSRHLTGHAIDVVAYVGGAVRWEFDLYRRIAEAFARAGDDLEVPIEWGGCWSRIDGATDLARLVGDYVGYCRGRGRRPLVDGPHFQLPQSGVYA